MFSYFLIEAESGEEGSIQVKYIIFQQNLIDMIADKVVRTK